jgi:hypothetical protein
MIYLAVSELAGQQRQRYCSVTLAITVVADFCMSSIGFPFAINGSISHELSTAIEVESESAVHWCMQNVWPQLGL